MAIKIYAVTNRDTDTVHRIRSSSFENATLIAFRRDYGQKRNLFALRQTGVYPLSGVYAVYQHVGRWTDGGSNTGPSRGYHVASPIE